jgi:urease accessory protein
MIPYRSLAAAAALVGAAPALAHVETHVSIGFAAGFLHPLGGLDHMLAMLAVGLFAGSLGGRAVWAVPAIVLLMMLTGSSLGYANIVVSAAEIGVAVSVVALGAIVAGGQPWSVGGAMAVAGTFAICHGYAHGVEMPGDAGVVPYTLGFLLASATMHAVGIGVSRIGPTRRLAGRLAGSAIAFAGIVLMVG